MEKAQVILIHFIIYRQNNNPPSYFRRRRNGNCNVDGAAYSATQVGSGGALLQKRHAGKYVAWNFVCLRYI